MTRATDAANDFGGAVPDSSSTAFTVATDGAMIVGESRGEAAKLVFLHGFSGEMHDWDRLWAAMSSDLAMLRYDLRGFGRASMQDRPFRHADDLLHLLNAQGIDRTTIVGSRRAGHLR